MAKNKIVPFYTHDAEYVEQHGELKQYWQSAKATADCAKEISEAIWNNYDGESLPDDMARGFLRKYGKDRVEYLLANTIRQDLSNKFYPPDFKEWAKTVTSLGEEDKRERNRINTHPAMFTLFFIQAWEEMRRMIPLSHEEIQTEAKRILRIFQSSRYPESPDGNYFMAYVSDDFIQRAKKKDFAELSGILPFASLKITEVDGFMGTYALISKDEDRMLPLHPYKPSIRAQLSELKAQQERPVEASPARDMPQDAIERSQQLMDRLEDNMSAFDALCWDMTTSELIESSRTITAVKDAYGYLKNISSLNEQEVNFLLQFDNPLEFVADKWRERLSDISDFSFALDTAFQQISSKDRRPVATTQNREAR